MTTVQVVLYSAASGEIYPDGVQRIPASMFDNLALAAGKAKLLAEGEIRSSTHRVDLSVTPPAVVSYTPPLDMNSLRREAKSQVDWKAAKLRSWMGSHGYGQEMVYLAKEIEARACTTDPVPDPARYPLLAAEVGITADALEEVAAAVVVKADEWKAIAAEIEAVRLATKKLIDAASTATEIDAAVATATWPTPPA